MCGVNGFVRKGVSYDEGMVLLEKMNHSLQHRGPNGRGMYLETWGDRMFGMGHVRLAIIDTSQAGHQPMFYTKEQGGASEKHMVHGDRSLGIVFNGEIYNYLEVKEVLEKKGYVFTTKTDTEVILASYEEYGEECVHSFNGMWSFVIYDRKKQKLFISRDRVGKKPFYYFFDGENFIFSSEIKSILVHDAFAIKRKENFDSEALDLYFTLGFIPSPWTIYKNVRKLQAGHSLVFDMRTYSIREYRYFFLAPYCPIFDKEALIAQGKELLRETVRIRMIRADVPVGAFLSGGIDSTTIVRSMLPMLSENKLNTFSIGFEGKYDETKYIDLATAGVSLAHHHQYFQKEDFEKMLSSLYYFYDEPFGDYSNLPTLFVCSLASKYVTVCLSGDGGDEIFGGYVKHRVAACIDALYRFPLFLRKFLYTILPGKGSFSFFGKCKELAFVSLFPKKDFYAQLLGGMLYKPEVYMKWTSQKLQELLERNQGNFVQSVLDFDLLYHTLGDNFLTKVDRASMSQALEVRCPFLDYRWIEWSRNVPVEWKVNCRETKILMREIIKDLIPESIRKRGKQGFEPPLQERLLEEKYVAFMKEGLETLYREKVVHDSWYKFYKEYIFQKDNSIYRMYRVRWFLFLAWYQTWIGKEGVCM